MIIIYTVSNRHYHLTFQLFGALAFRRFNQGPLWFNQPIIIQILSALDCDLLNLRKAGEPESRKNTIQALVLEEADFKKVSCIIKTPISPTQFTTPD